MDEKTEKLLAIETVIRKFAETQFVMNHVSSVEAMLITKSIFSDMSSRCFSESIEKRIRFNEPLETEVKKGTAEDLMKDFQQTGFEPKTESIKE